MTTKINNLIEFVYFRKKCNTIIFEKFDDDYFIGLILLEILNC